MCPKLPLVNNPPFRHWYGNLSQVTRPHAMAHCGYIEDVPEEPKKDSDDGNSDQTPDSDLTLTLIWIWTQIPIQILTPNLTPNPNTTKETWSKACPKLSRVSPSPFTKTQANQKWNAGILIHLIVLIWKKLRGFLLQCKLNFWSKPKSFQTE